jgi:alkaline phosphatase D
MLGSVTPTSAKLWLRTANEVPVHALVSNSAKMTAPVKTRQVKTTKEKDFTAIITLTRLKADTAYYYQLVVDGRKLSKVYSFKTFPAAGEPAKFNIGFGGGAGYSPQYERMWNTLTANKLPAFLMLGDNVYIDHPEYPAVQKYCYYRRQSRPEYKNFIPSTSIFAIWDDHDFTENDSVGGPEIDYPEWKRPVWNVFKNNWLNPYYAGGEKQPGCWFDFYLADVHFILLDCRYYNTGPKADNPSMLGPVQKKWLFEKLKSSKGTFIVLASSVPWDFGAKPGSKDPWNGFHDEREEIFLFLADNQIEGVILISADRHRSDLWKIDRTRGYPLYEFESSKLTNIVSHSVMEKSIFGYNEKCSFGLLEFDTTQADPLVSYKIINIDDELIYSFTVKKSQLAEEK